MFRTLALFVAVLIFSFVFVDNTNARPIELVVSSIETIHANHTIHLTACPDPSCPPEMRNIVKQDCMVPCADYACLPSSPCQVCYKTLSSGCCSC